jgi:ABC-2 type transport system permease protein
MSAHWADLGGFSVARVGAMVLRYLYLLRSSWPRVLELIYWPTVQMITWGFLQSYLGHGGAGGPTNNLALAGGVLIGSMLLWDVLMRGQLGFSIGFLEEMWSRNIGNLFMSPLRPIEFVASLMVMSIVRLAISMVPVTLLAIAFFGYNLWALGFGVGIFFANLIITAWAIGLIVCGVVLRNGMGAEGLIWGIVFVMMPFCCIYYPVSVLPGWLQMIAWALPPTYVFEGLRAITSQQVFRADLMLTAFLINVVWMGAATFVFLKLVESSRKAGTLLQMGE